MQGKQIYFVKRPGVGNEYAGGYWVWLRIKQCKLLCVMKTK